MFVLPPPPRYPNGNLYTGVPGGGLIETNNILHHYEGPEYQLVVGEGTYVLRDEIHLATPPPHPSDVSAPNNNPLLTTIGPPTAGTKLSLTILSSRRSPNQALFRLNSLNRTFSNVPPSISEEKTNGNEDGSSKTNGTAMSYAAVFGDNNPALQPPSGKEGKDASKKRKPKNNMVKSNSSFVSRVIPHEALQKRLNERGIDGLFAFANINRAVQWLDLSSETKTENLTKILFTKAHALCHDVNQVTKSTSHIDVVFGFSTSDVIWYEPITQKYARLNKNGIINSAPISAIQWLPNSEHLLVAAHNNGCLVFYDKDKEDAPFVPEDTPVIDGPVNCAATPRVELKKSVQSRNQKTNPVAYWKIGNTKINALSFSPSGSHLALVCEDGTLRIIDFLKEELRDVYRSYYGALSTVTWSPDGRYILTGGQDDLVSIWSFTDRCLIARCQGHNSWVTDVKFDPWRCDERNYRFGSVGEDCRLLLWDFSVGMLGRPKAMANRQRGSVSSAPMVRKDTNGSLTGRKRSTSNLVDEESEDRVIVHPVDSRASTAMLPPVMSRAVDDHPVTWLGFEEDCILTTCKEGHLRTWDRPKEGAGEGS